MNVQPKVVAYQGHLENCLRYLFPHESIITNATKQAPIKDEHGNYLELDIYFPSLNLAFEFQDIHHFDSAWYYHNSLESVQNRDRMKVEIANKNGISLLQIPCWWDIHTESLAASISFHRPDLINYISFPITLNPRIDHLGGGISQIGSLMLASFLPASVSLDKVIAAKSWWMGEKYDGIRFCWNALLLQSRSGLELALPANMISTIKELSLFLDGELWFGRGTFLESQQLVHPTVTINWATLRMIVFDSPNPRLFSLPFESRYANLINDIESDHPVAITAPRILCTTSSHLSTTTSSLIEQGAEGVIMRQSNSAYVAGRSSALIKFKEYRGDSEALVASVTPSCAVLQLPNGMTIKAHHSTSVMPKRGDVVTFSFSGSSQWGVPLDALVFRIRKDLSWDDVIIAATTGGPGVSSKSTEGGNLESRQRVEMEKVAKKHNRDPLVPDTWYFLFKELENKYAQGALAKLLMRLFPDIGLEKSKFPTAKYVAEWQSASERRRYLVKVAEEHGFDPLIAKHWFSLTYKNIKGISSLVKYYEGSIAKALLHLFPEIGIDSSKFPVPREHWDIAKYRRELFEKIAQFKGLDPLSPETWYSLPANIIHNFKGIRTVLKFYDNSIPAALMHLFPDIGLRKHLFKADYPRNHWKDSNNRKIFFKEYARDKGFDPLLAENWYPVSIYSLSSQQGSDSVLKYHNGSLSSALLSAFPNIGLEQHKFLGNRNSSHLPRDYWKDNENQKSFFINFATQHNFDPLIPANWLTINTGHLLQEKGVGSVLAHYNNSIPQALHHLFQHNSTKSIVSVTR